MSQDVFMISYGYSCGSGRPCGGGGSGGSVGLVVLVGLGVW